MSKLNTTWQIIKPYLRNKYFLLIFGFGTYITFFDEHNLIDRFKLNHKIGIMEDEYIYYQKEIKESKQMMLKLQYDNKYLETFAREKYHLKSKNEEIFLIDTIKHEEK